MIFLLGYYKSFHNRTKIISKYSPDGLTWTARLELVVEGDGVPGLSGTRRNADLLVAPCLPACMSCGPADCDTFPAHC
jgi:hypothetical protein